MDSLVKGAMIRAGLASQHWDQFLSIAPTDGTQRISDAGCSLGFANVEAAVFFKRYIVFERFEPRTVVELSAKAPNLFIRVT